jgi:hypothetical protein
MRPIQKEDLLRRKVMTITVLCLLVGAAVAYAAAGPNSYAGTNQTFDKGVGSAAHPIGVGFKQTLAAKNTDSTKAAEVLIDIKTKIYGLVSNAKSFPTCSASKMSAQKSDSFCPKLSKFASGHVDAKLGDPTLAMSNRIPCKPDLDVFHAGGNKLWFFFTTKNTLQCAGLTTGVTPPYPGTITQQGKFQVTDVPLPPVVSTKVAGQPNFYGSLVHETLNWIKVKTTKNGKTISNNVSVGCKNGKRPWSITFTSTPDGHTKHTQTVNGSSKC